MFSFPVMVSYGVISTPEVTDWELLTNNDSYLVVASDGIFEKMTTQQVCDLLWVEKTRLQLKLEPTVTSTRSLAEQIVQAAFESGSMDNLSAVVIQLGFTGVAETSIEDLEDLERTSVSSYFDMKNIFGTSL